MRYSLSQTRHIPTAIRVGAFAKLWGTLRGIVPVHWTNSIISRCVISSAKYNHAPVRAIDLNKCPRANVDTCIRAPDYGGNLVLSCYNGGVTQDSPFFGNDATNAAEYSRPDGSGDVTHENLAVPDRLSIACGIAAIGVTANNARYSSYLTSRSWRAPKLYQYNVPFHFL